MTTATCVYTLINRAGWTRSLGSATRRQEEAEARRCVHILMHISLLSILRLDAACISLLSILMSILMLILLRAVC